MEFLWPALVAIAVITSVAGILAVKRSSFFLSVFYVLLFLFFALAAFTLLKISFVSALAPLAALILLVLILLKGKRLQLREHGGDDLEGQESEDADENR